jgi:UDP-GlcNAc:undecaprenyl-phosphate GlcNAc-1-phosphate transferase
MTLWIARVGAERRWTRQEEGAGNEEAVPRLGGVGVFLATLLTLGLLLLWDNQISERLAREQALGVGLLAGTAAVFLLGLYDDLRGAGPWQKLFIQLGAAFGLYCAGFRVGLLTNPMTHNSVELGWMSLPVTLLWLVALSNAFNLIDGLDGLAAGIGLFATLALFLLAVLVGNAFVAAIAVALAGALLGFLPHNFNPARIYMGDAGSLTAGLVLAALAVESAQKGPVLITVVIPMMIFGLPLLDVSVTTLRRFLSGHPLFLRDQEHLHHRLVKIGLTKRGTVVVLYGVAALFALASLLLLNYKGVIAPLIAVLCGALAWLMVRQMHYPEFTELDSHVRLGLRSQRRVLRNQILLRKAASDLTATVSLEELWQTMGSVFEALEFDFAACEFSLPGGNGTRLLRWMAAHGAEEGSAGAELFWTLSIPLGQDGNRVGVLRLGRAPNRGPLLFRVSSLLEFVSEAFCLRLLQFLEQESETRVSFAAAS